MAEKRRSRLWDQTPQAAAYRAEYDRTHYRKLVVRVPIADADAYKAACAAAGIPLSRPLADAVADVLSGKYRPL